MRALSRLIGTGYGLAGAGYASMLRPVPAGILAWPIASPLVYLGVVALVGLLAAVHGLIAYAFLTLKPWGRWPVTVVNLLYLLCLGFVLVDKLTAMAFILVAVLLGVIWWSWQPGFPARVPGLRGWTGARAVLNRAVLTVLVLLLVLIGFELQRHLRRCAEEFVLDEREGCLTPLVFREDTEYAGGYSAAAFKQLQPGMTEQEVRALLGPPLDQWALMESGAVEWRWTRSPGSNSYRERVVHFLDGRVSEIFHGFYID